MASLLSKFRIDYSALKVIPDISKPAQNTTKSFFDSLIANFQETENTKTMNDGIIFMKFLLITLNYEQEKIKN